MKNKPGFPPRDRKSTQETATVNPPQNGPREHFQISGAIGIGSGRVTPEEQAAASLLLSEIFGDANSNAPATAEIEASRDDSNISLGEEGKQSGTKLDDLLAGAVVGAGYRRVAKLTYRADWSTADVEHILTFDTFGRPKAFLTGDVGLRNTAADAFAEQCKRRYADPVIRNSDFVPPPWWCSMHCSLRMLANWTGADLYIPKFPQPELKKIVADAIRNSVLPYVGDVTTERRLFDFLAQDTEPMRWSRVGPFFRAAEVAFLGRKLGVASAELQEIMRSHWKFIANGIDTKMLTPAEYVLRIISDADAALNRTG